MTTLAPTLQAFFTQRLIGQLGASPHTVGGCRDTCRLLLCFAQQQTGKAPCQLELSDLDAPLIGAFLEHLETQRGNSPRTRNARLAAVHSLFRFAALRHPEHAALIQRVLAIPAKRCDRALVSFLSPTEVDALLAAPDRASWLGRRDHALLLVAVTTGLRVCELTGIACQDVHLGGGPHVRCRGKGRKQRATPLSVQTVTVPRAWARERDGQPADPLFPTRGGGPLSRDAVQYAIAEYATAAARRCPSLAAKRVSPHVLRHTSALRLLQAGVDIATIALWLGHESIETTRIYLHADLSLKQRALERTAPVDCPPGRYQAPDDLLAFLDSL